MSYTVFLGNLPLWVTADDIKFSFERFTKTDSKGNKAAYADDFSALELPKAARTFAALEPVMDVPRSHEPNPAPPLLPMLHPLLYAGSLALSATVATGPSACSASAPFEIPRDLQLPTASGEPV